jgi:GT2 family glycosyltransferase
MNKKPVQIYITSWFRLSFLKKTIQFIRERTEPNSYLINIFDNGSDIETRNLIYEYLNKGIINVAIFDRRNTGCLYNKLIYHAMVENKDEYYCVTDNDVYPPKLSPDWLNQMISIMDNHPELAMLTPQLPPQYLQMPYDYNNEVIYAKAIGNTFKIIRRRSLNNIISNIEQSIGKYGDDGQISDLLNKAGWKVGFCRNIFCFHAGQCEDWGYTKEQIDLDPRKKGYGGHFKYKIVNEKTYEPEPRYKI